MTCSTTCSSSGSAGSSSSSSVAAGLAAVYLQQLMGRAAYMLSVGVVGTWRKLRWGAVEHCSYTLD